MSQYELLSQEDFLDKVYNFRNDIEILSKYKGYRNPIKVKCLRCGNKFTINAAGNIFNTKNLCKKCRTPHNKKTLEDIKKEIKFISNDEYELLSDEYKNNKTRMLFKHKKCGKEFYQCFNKFKTEGRRCPHCVNSNGEEVIKEYLDRNNISYEREVAFEECRHNKPLKFDFYLEEYNLLIEFDGKQHFLESFSDKPSNNSLKEIQKRDKIKNKFANEYEINLLRISYKEISKINKILDEYLK